MGKWFWSLFGSATKIGLAAWLRLAAHERKRATAELVATVLVVVMGFGIGWLAGGPLSRALRSARADGNSPPQIEPQPPSAEVQPTTQSRGEDRDEVVIKIPGDKHSAKEFGRKVLKNIFREIYQGKHHGKHKGRD